MSETKKILCIDDEQDIIGLVEVLLSAKGYQVFGALGGKEGLEAMRRVRPDLILLDLMLPDMDGAAIYRHMQADEELEDIPIIVLTAVAQPMEKTLWQQVIRIDDYIIKPFSSHRLLESISRVLAARTK